MLSDGDWPYKLVVLDPETGERRDLNEDLRGLKRPATVPGVTVLSNGDLWLNWSSSRGSHRNPDNWQLRGARYDLDTWERTDFTAPHPKQAKFPAPVKKMLPGTDGRLYFMTGRVVCGDGECGQAKRAELWSFDPGDPDDIRKEANPRYDRLDGFTIAGSVLAWVEQTGPKRDDEGYLMYYDTTVHTRDLETGEEHSRTFDDCYQGTTDYRSYRPRRCS